LARKKTKQGRKGKKGTFVGHQKRSGKNLGRILGAWGPTGNPNNKKKG